MIQVLLALHHMNKTWQRTDALQVLQHDAANLGENIYLCPSVWLEISWLDLEAFFKETSEEAA